MNDDIKFLYSAKQHLNQQLLQLYLTSANSCNNVWPYIQHTIEEEKWKDYNILILVVGYNVCLGMKKTVRHEISKINLLTPNVNYSSRTAPLTSKVTFYIFIQQI